MLYPFGSLITRNNCFVFTGIKHFLVNLFFRNLPLRFDMNSFFPFFQFLVQSYCIVRWAEQVFSACESFERYYYYFFKFPKFFLNIFFGSIVVRSKIVRCSYTNFQFFDSSSFLMIILIIIILLFKAKIQIFWKIWLHSRSRYTCSDKL